MILINSPLFPEVECENYYKKRIIANVRSFAMICLKGQHFIQYGGNKKRENTT